MPRSKNIRKPLFAVLGAALLLMPMQQGWKAHAAGAVSLPFDDLAGSYAQDAIVRLEKLDLIEGTGARRFEPRKAVTRAELVTMLDRLLGLEPVEAAVPAFTDVATDAWYAPWVQAAVHAGLTSGVSPSRFAPKQAVSREEAAALIARALQMSNTATAGASSSAYRDQSAISAWALPAVLSLRQAGVMLGDGTAFRPGDPVSRQEAAVFLDRIWSRSGWSQQFQAAPPAKIQLGWQYGQTTAEYEQSVLRSNVNTLSPRWFFLDKTTGAIAKQGADTSLIRWAHKRGKQVWPLVGNRFDADATHAMLSDPDKRAAAVRLLADEARGLGLDGLNLDFEGMNPADRDAFTGFVRELADALRPDGIQLSVCVSPDDGTDWTDAIDYGALGRSADYLVLMAYDEHWAGQSAAGSVASLPWVTSGLDQLLKEVTPSKVILAMPLYTRDWTLANGGVSSVDLKLPEQQSIVRSRDAKPVWDSKLAQYVAEYRAGGTLHRIWLEDGRSLSAKAELGERRGVAGYAYWAIGGDTPDVWTSLRNRLRLSSYTF